MPAGTGADAAGFKEGNALFGLEVPKPCRRGQPGKTAANDGEIDRIRHRNQLGMEFNSPRGRPIVVFALYWLVVSRSLL